jgi:hypothetical protein
MCLRDAPGVSEVTSGEPRSIRPVEGSTVDVRARQAELAAPCEEGEARAGGRDKNDARWRLEKKVRICNCTLSDYVFIGIKNAVPSIFSDCASIRIRPRC